MAGNNNIFNNHDTMDINELAALNQEDFSPEMIEQLQQQITQNSIALESTSNSKKFDENDDTTLFEEPAPKIVQEELKPQQEESQDSETIETFNGEIGETESQMSANKADESKQKPVAQNFDDNFIKKYKAKLNKQNNIAASSDEDNSNSDEQDANASIEELSKGQITEKKLTKEQRDYNKSLDFLDGNVKYSKYVIYIDPQNVDFIESLTVKERKNLINRVIREQDDIKIAKNRVKIVQAVIMHILIAIFTVAISIPMLYYILNASLEATIDNYRRSQTNFQTLYKSHGKISNQR